MKKLRLKQIAAIGLLVILLVGVYYGLQHIGFNATTSLDFRLYYHTAYMSEKAKKGDYILFELPENELYPAGLKVVKSIACMPGDTLETKAFQDKINYYCNDALISTATIFKTSTGEPIHPYLFGGIIPEAVVFVLGDKNNSFDSRYWGFLPEADIERSVHPIRLVSAAFAATGYETVKDTGWYKYKETPKKEKTPEDNKTAAIVPDNTAKTTGLAKPSIPWEKVSTMPVKDFSKLFEDVQDYALTYRTLENFDTYARLRQVMFQRSAEFMNVGTLWGQLHPEATDEDWFPTSGFGQEAYQAQTAAIRSSYIRDNRENFGLLYFYRETCGFCQKQTPIIRYFEDMSGWKVKAVDADRIPEAVARFNVKSVPMLVLVERETERWLPVASGLMTYEELEERLYRTIKYLNGESYEKDYSNPIRPDNYIVKSSAGGMD